MSSWSRSGLCSPGSSQRHRWHGARSSSLTRDLGLESIDVVDLFFEIEQSTGVVISSTRLSATPRAAAADSKTSPFKI